MNHRKKSRTRRTSTNFMVDYMNGKWRAHGKPSRRSAEVEDSEDEEPEHVVTNWAEEFFGKRNASIDNDGVNDQDVDIHLTKKQTLILSTLVPDEILLMEKQSVGEPKRFVGVLMMADVSGFTALSERYSNTGKGGTYRLTATLNSYLGALIELIYSHGGDIIKFAGDAFLACWKTDKKTFLCHTIHSVIVCALVIQHSYARYETDVKVNLRVKLAISAGNLMFSTIGAGTDMNYVIFGLPVLEAKLAESLCASGEVKLTPSAWAHCYSRNYDHTVHENGHVTIKTILYDPHDIDVTKPFLGFGALLRQPKKTYCAIENLPDHLMDSKNLVASEIMRKVDALSLRKAILIAEEQDKGIQIRNFMVRPVLTQIDAHQPLEYLTEMRQVSVMFITLKPRECPPTELITIVNNSYQITCEIVYKSMGCVNKIILFDKDVMILVIFGLRGFKHESEAQAALKCAYGVKKSVSALDGVNEVSIGVTTGSVYCGVVGHPLRREFTVIGAIVNKAARLMCSFRNKITCDEATFVKSKMSKNGFTLQPRIELKGIGQPGKIYEYTEEIRVKELYNIAMIPPLLNRSDETDYFESWLDQSDLPYRDFDALLFIGESRIGKTRMLEWLSRVSANRNFRVCYLSLSSIHSANSYLALSQIINLILDLTEPVTGFDKEQKIVELLKVYDEELCYLNNIIKVRFAYHEGIYSLDEQMRKDKAKLIFKKIIDAISETHIIFLDDLQNLDSLSWEFMSIMLRSHKIFTVLTVTRGKFSSVHRWLYSVFIESSIRKIVLGPLETTLIPPLACQLLDVDAVPNDLCNALRTKCKGMPGLVESFIVHLFSNGALEIKRINDNDLEDYKAVELQFPTPELLKPQALDANNQEKLDQLIATDTNGEISICIVTNKDELNTNINEHNLDVLIMVQIDSLTPYQQLLLKIASVIGNVFSRDLLENIMYENNTITTARAVKRLFAMRILSCANSKIKWIRKKGISLSSTYSGGGAAGLLECDCSFEFDPDNSENLPKYAFCKEMRFRNKNSQKTCYELLPMNQKKEFHTRILNYLENNNQKCPTCGGTVRILQSVSFQLETEINLSASPSQQEETSSNDSSQEGNDYYREYSRSTKSDPVIKSQNSSLFKTGSTNVILFAEGTSSESSNKSKSSSFLKSNDDDSFLNRSSKRVTISSLNSRLKEEQNSYEGTGIFGMIRQVLEARKTSDWHELGVIDSKDDVSEEENLKTFAVSIERGISETNFKKCTCTDLNILIYGQLIHHAMQAEMKSKAIEYLIHYSYLNLLADSTESSLEKLEEALHICTDKAIVAPDLTLYLGRIYSLKAACCLLNGKLLESKLELEKAARIYGLRFNNGSYLFRIKNLFKIRRKKLQTHENVMKADSLFCINVATTLFSALGDQKLSRNCALLALNVVRRVDCRVVDMCDAFDNAIQIELERGCPEGTLEIERIVQHTFHHLPQPIKADELYALGKLYLAYFRAKTARGNLPSAIRAGFRAVVVSNFMHAYDVTVDIIPDIFYILLSRRRIEEAIDILQLSLRLTGKKTSHVCETWYYALCMDLILDAGLQLESPEEINRYSEFSLLRKIGGPARRRLVVNLWTYWLRMDVEKRAKRFEDEALSWLSREDDDGTLTSLVSALRLIEGLLESLARKMDDLRKVVDLMELRSIADRELSALETDCRVMRVIHCRWMRLKACSLSLSGRQAAATALYNQALEEAKRINNFLEEQLSRAYMVHSKLWIENARAGNFTHWRSGLDQTRDSWHQTLYKISISRW